MKQFSDCAAPLLAILLFVCGPGTVCEQQPASNGPATLDFTDVKPESVGFSSERWERLHSSVRFTETGARPDGSCPGLQRFVRRCQAHHARTVSTGQFADVMT